MFIIIFFSYGSVITSGSRFNVSAYSCLISGMSWWCVIHFEIICGLFQRWTFGGHAEISFPFSRYTHPVLLTSILHEHLQFATHMLSIFSQSDNYHSPFYFCNLYIKKFFHSKKISSKYVATFVIKSSVNILNKNIQVKYKYQ